MSGLRPWLMIGVMLWAAGPGPAQTDAPTAPAEGSPAQNGQARRQPKPPDLYLSGLFGDGAVLAADHPLAIWGLASKGATVRVTLDGDSAESEVAADGQWRVELPSRPASEQGRSYELTVTARRGAQTTVETRENLVFGDLWLCAGQSNMNRPLSQTEHAADVARDIQADGMLRMLRMPNRGLNHPPRHVDSRWISLAADNIQELPAVPVYFGQALRQGAQRPIGLIVAACSGSRCEAWIDPDRLRGQPQFAELFENAEAFMQSFKSARQSAEENGAEEEDQSQQDQDEESDGLEDLDEGITNIRLYRKRAPGVLYNGMIAPLRGLHLRGVAWYQGESNALRPEQYGSLLMELLNNWRQAFDGHALPIAVVQLPKFELYQLDQGRNLWAQMREAQRRACQALPGVDLIVTIDLGDGLQLHPTLKQPIGRRLADWALSQVYHQPADFPGPQPLDVVREGAQLRVRFNVGQATLGTSNGQAPQLFELVDVNATSLPVDAILDGQAVVLNVPADFHPAAVRYAWVNNPTQANLCDDRGLPCPPFELPVPSLP